MDGIRLILRDLLKVIKVVAMYPENNPLPQSLKRTFAERLVQIVGDCGTIDLDVHKSTLNIRDEVVFSDGSREERLAGLFFETGITQISFKAGIDETNIYRLLEAIKEFQNAQRGSADLAGILWEANVSGFAFRTVEDVALQDYDGDFKVDEEFLPGRLAGEVVTPEEQARRLEALFNETDKNRLARSEDDSGIFISGTQEHGFHDDDDQSELSKYGTPSIASDADQEYVDVRSAGGRRGPKDEDSAKYIVGTVLDFGEDEDSNARLNISDAVKAMGLGDLTGKAPRVPDTTLILNDEFRLSEEEEIRVDSLLVADAAFSVHESTAELIKEMLHQEVDLQGFSETVQIGEKVVTEFIKAGKIPYATETFRYFKELEARIKLERPQWAERLREAVVMAGSRERLQHLTNALNNHGDIGAIEIRSYLDLFDWQALMGVSEMLGRLEHDLHRTVISDYLAQKGQGNMALVAKGIFDNKPEVVTASITVLAQIGDDQALGYLKKLVKHKDMAVRRVLVQKLEGCANESAIHLLKQLATDEDVDVRRGAVRSLVARRGVAAFDAVADLVKGEHFEQIDDDDKRSLLTAYSVLGGDMAVEFLEELATKLTLFGGGEQSLLQQMAFEALAHNRGNRSEKVLLKHASSWRPKIKELAAEALRERRRILFGTEGEDEVEAVDFGGEDDDAQ